MRVARSRPGLLSLPFALSPSTKAAHISVLPEFHSAQPFPRQDWNKLEAFKPSVLIGYAYDLTKLVESVESEAVQLTTLDRAIYALTDCGMPVIEDALRHKLWQVFGVPVYELIVAPGCILLAAECELHNGWHLQPGVTAQVAGDEIVYNLERIKRARSGFSGSIDPGECECGRKTSALRNLKPISRSHKMPILSLAS